MRGLLEPFLAEGRRLPRGHFAGIPLDFTGLPTRYPFLLNILQRRIERLLEARARDLGVRMRREIAVTGLRQTSDRVELETTQGEIAAEFVVGCDGGRSTVRKLAGIDFPGTPATMTAILGDVELASPPTEPVFQQRTPYGNWSSRSNFEPGLVSRDDQRLRSRCSTGTRRSPSRICESRCSSTPEPTSACTVHGGSRGKRCRPARVALPVGPGVAGRRRRAHPLPGRRPGPEHGRPGRVQPGLEARPRTPNRSRSRAARHVRGGAPARGGTRPRQHACPDRAHPGRTRRPRRYAGLLPDLSALGDVNRSLSEMLAGLDIRYAELGPGVGQRVSDVDLPDGTRLYQHFHSARHRFSSAARRRAWVGRGAWRGVGRGAGRGVG